MQTKRRKPPTPKRHFEMRALCLELVAGCAIADAQSRAKEVVSEGDQAWFIEQAETWVRWFHANCRKWRNRLERESDDDRDFVSRFMNHWADAFVRSPATYKERHPILSR